MNSRSVSSPSQHLTLPRITPSPHFQFSDSYPISKIPLRHPHPDLRMQSQHLSPSSSQMKHIKNLIKCTLCLSYLHDPVTLSCCGNTFCLSCILRIYDVQPSPKCALCRIALPQQKQLVINRTLSQLLQCLVPPHKLEQRRLQDSIEFTFASNSTQPVEIPLFVLNCILYPSAALPLHVFEPKYRLMIRRCLRGSKRFGLVCVAPEKSSGSAQRSLRRVGTLCRIEHVHTFDDGRMFIMTRAEKRFCLENGTAREISTQDGYPNARVTWIHRDMPCATDEEHEECLTLCKQLHTVITQFLTSMSHGQSKILGLVQQKIGDVPPHTEVEAFSFWASSFLSGLMDQEYAYNVLQCHSTRDRLRALASLATQAFERDDTKQSLFLRKQLGAEQQQRNETPS